MKNYLIQLKDKRAMRIKAKSYTLAEGKYVFDGTASGEAEFVMADSVVSITVEAPRATITRARFS